ncbi:MAG: ABC transporter ATP-binding protein [Deltaproteobacteria bacterium]|nr:ABC transporter ATP-binding protein [Deltaproteobacteria bacterium]
MLQTHNIQTFYGKSQALYDVSITVEASEIVALVGSNGAGKTTLLKTISGVLRPASGQVEFLGQRIEGRPSYAVVEQGISHIPEGRKLFTDMSVQENLEMGAYPKRTWKQKQETLEEIYHLLPVLKVRKGQVAGTLSGGEQQMVALGRGLMSRPKLCMIDEPSSALAPVLVDEIFNIIQGLHDQGIAIFLVEQNVRHTLEIADRAYVIENGKIILKGDSEKLLSEDHIRKAYLGL